ncbi:MAG: hypothetical protein PF542_01435 [Nanoarchaeota archaeon]|jgi:hypothetical protein|nr:hypothetical protein [Nanoarchaeota archaeon]
MRIEIDVSGQDLFHKDYSICVVDKRGCVKSFRFKEEVIDKIKSHWKNREYTIPSYAKPARFKFKLYSIVVQILLGNLLEEEESKEISIHFCRDFPSYEKQTENFLIQEMKKHKDKTIVEIECG